MSNYLYHFFPRRFEGEEKVITMIGSVFRHGLHLSKEIRRVDWEDKYALNGYQRNLEALQYRFCLTAITNELELIAHADSFGFIGLAFSEETVLKLGGFPVFYVPTPRNEYADIEEYKGVSLLYRLADAQQILEYIVRNRILESRDIDLENVLGSIKFLANIFYPTYRNESGGKTGVCYYNQREWRVIYNLTSDKVRIGDHLGNYTIEAFNNEPIRNFISKIVVFPSKNISNQVTQRIYRRVEDLVSGFGMKCKVEYFDDKPGIDVDSNFVNKRT